MALHQGLGRYFRFYNTDRAAVRVGERTRQRRISDKQGACRVETGRDCGV